MLATVAAESRVPTHLCPASTGNPVQNEETGLTEFRLTGPLRYLTWYHAVGLVWITEFILACQQMTVAGAVVTYYFTRCSPVGRRSGANHQNRGRS